MNKLLNDKILKSSFRDPAGYLFYKDAVLYRLVSKKFERDFCHFLDSGLKEELTKNVMLTDFIVTDLPPYDHEYCIIKPEFIEHITYPYEWCFTQLKDAALLTLSIAKKALEFDMELKDASAYNIQFVNGKPQFIDTLSFRIYDGESPWVAYNQFCRHFLAPLILMSKIDIGMNSLLQLYIDGIPIDITCKLLGRKKFLPSAFIHLYLQNRISSSNMAAKRNNKTHNFGKKSFLRILDSLTSTVENLNVKLNNNFWGDYYNNKILSNEYLENKKILVNSYLASIKAETIYDLGANNGIFSQIASKYCKQVISADLDHECVEANYLFCKKNNVTSILPVFLNLCNPAPSIGWQNNERDGFFTRMKFDTILSLALFHHLAIGNNVPTQKIVDLFKDHCQNLVIEFIPLSDPKAQELLHNRENIFENLSQTDFEENFRRHFELLKSDKIKGSERILYLMRNKNEHTKR